MKIWEFDENLHDISSGDGERIVVLKLANVRDMSTSWWSTIYEYDVEV